MDEDNNGGHARQLTPRQREALPHVLAPGSVSQKARNAGISRKTLYRWMRDSDFRFRLEQARADAMRLADTQLQLVTHEAVAVLYDMLVDDKPAIRMRTAQSIVRYGLDAYYGTRLERRIDAIEDSISLREGRRIGTR